MRIVLMFVLVMVLAACGQILPLATESMAEGEAAHAAPVGGPQYLPVDAGVASDAAGTPSVSSSDASMDCTAPIVHQSGSGRTYRSCLPIGTLTVEAATLACRGFARDMGESSATCILAAMSPCAGGAITMVGVATGRVVGTWDFAGPHPGNVSFDYAEKPACPEESDLAIAHWN